MNGPLPDNQPRTGGKRVYVAGKRVAASRVDGARAERWAVIRLAWWARSEAVRGASPERRSAGALLGRLLGDSDRVHQVSDKLAPRVVGGDPVAVVAASLLTELRERLAEADAAA